MCYFTNVYSVAVRVRQAITLFLCLNNLKHLIVAASNSHDTREASISPSIQLLWKRKGISILKKKKKSNYSIKHKWRCYNYMGYCITVWHKCSISDPPVQ